MSSVVDLISSLKMAFRDASFSHIENELLSREEKFKHEIKVQMSEIEKQRKEIEEQRKRYEELEEQLEFVRLDKIRIEQDFKDKCKDNEYCQELLEKMKSRVTLAEEELVNFKSLKASLENDKGETIEVDGINQKVPPRNNGDEKLQSEKIVEILDSDEDCAQSEMDVKKVPDKPSMDNFHLDQKIPDNESGVLKRKQALVVGEGNGNGHDSDDRHKRIKVEKLITGLVNSPINQMPKTINSPPHLGSLKKELNYLNVDSDSSEGSTSSDDSDEDINSDHLFKSIFITKAQANVNQKKWKCEAEIKAALEKDETLCMKAVCALSRQQNSSGKIVSDSSTSEHLGFDKLYAQRGFILSKFLTSGDPEGKLKKSVADLKAYDPKGLVDCRRIAIAHVKQLFKISQQNDASRFLN